MYNIKYSVIIPTYNRATILINALRSLHEQTYKNFEVIIVDDGSTDNTAELVKQFKLTNLKYIYINNSGTAAHPRNIGIENATGEWVCFMDSDDIWYPHKLERLNQYIFDYYNCKWFCHSEIMRKMNGDTSKLEISGYYKQFYKNLLYGGNFISTSTVVIKRDVIQNYRFNVSSDYFIVEDYDLWLNLSKSYDLFCIREFLGEYILQTDSISNNKLKFKTNLRNVIEFHSLSNNIKYNIYSASFQLIFFDFNLFTFLKSIPFSFSFFYYRSIRKLKTYTW